MSIDTKDAALEKAKNAVMAGKTLSEYLFMVSDDCVWVTRGEYEALELTCKWHSED